MKLIKTLALSLAVLLTVCTLFGCAGSHRTDATVTKGVLTLATSADFPPYEFYDGETIVGIDVEIAQAIADQLGLTLQIEDMDFNAIVPAVQNKKYDIGMAGLTIDPDRDLVVDFSDSYATGIQVIIVPENSPITCCDDLFDNIGTYKIGVQLATTGDLYACDDFGSENVEEYSKCGDAILALTSGKIDAVILDKEPAKSFVEANPGLKLLDTEYTAEDYAIIAAEGNTALLDQINEALAALTADGTIDQIVAKYINAG